MQHDEGSSCCGLLSVHERGMIEACGTTGARTR